MSTTQLQRCLAIMDQAVAVLRRNILPSSSKDYLHDEDAIEALLGILDGPGYRDAIKPDEKMPYEDLMRELYSLRETIRVRIEMKIDPLPVCFFDVRVSKKMAQDTQFDGPAWALNKFARSFRALLLKDSIVANAVGIPLVIFCPRCGVQHIDADGWEDRPHRRHLCLHCSFEFQPANCFTIGVRELPACA